MVQTINPALTGSISSTIPGFGTKKAEAGGFDSYLQSILSSSENNTPQAVSDESRIEISYPDEAHSHDKGKEPVEEGQGEKIANQTGEERKEPADTAGMPGESKKSKDPLERLSLKKLKKEKRETKLAIQVTLDPKSFAIQDNEHRKMGKLSGKKSLLPGLIGSRKLKKGVLKLALKDLSPGVRKDIKKLFSDVNKKAITLDQLKDRMMSALQNENLVKPLKSESAKKKAQIKITDVTENKKSASESPLKALSLKDLQAGEKAGGEKALNEEAGKITSAGKTEKNLLETDVKKSPPKGGKVLEKETAPEDRGEVFDIKSGDDKKNDPIAGVKKSSEPLAAKNNQSSQVQRALVDNKQRILDQVANNSKVIVANKETSFSTMLRPESLGRVDMKFSMKDGKLSGKIILQSQEAADFFRANVEDIRAVFSKSDVEMGNIDVLVAGKDSGMGSGNEQFQSGRGSEGQEAEKAMSTVSKEYSAVQDVFEDNSLQSSGDYQMRSDTRINVVI